jgi:hypothetical protein
VVYREKDKAKVLAFFLATHRTEKRGLMLWWKFHKRVLWSDPRSLQPCATVGSPPPKRVKDLDSPLLSDSFLNSSLFIYTPAATSSSLAVRLCSTPTPPRLPHGLTPPRLPSSFQARWRPACPHNFPSAWLPDLFPLEVRPPPSSCQHPRVASCVGPCQDERYHANCSPSAVCPSL